MQKIGLTLGKFAPLHKGHQLIIDIALQIVDRLYVLVYDAPETTNIPLVVRANWIRDIYSKYKKKIIVLEGKYGPTVEGATEEIKRIQEEYVKSMIPENITDFFSSEWYGEHISSALGAYNQTVDINRRNYPISGSIIRANRKNLVPYKKFLHPIVYSDLVPKIVFLGAESTGKTTLTEALAKKYDTTFAPEHGREFWVKYNKNGKLTQNQLYQLALEHLEIEKKRAQDANKIFFVDTNAWTTILYSEHYHGEVDQRLMDLAIDNEWRYDHTCVCDIDIPYVDDGTRNGEKSRKEFQEKIIRGFHNPSYILSGSLEERMQIVEFLL